MKEATLHNYLFTLFNRGEAVCYGNDAKAYKVFTVESLLIKRSFPNFICINPLEEHKDNAPYRPWHHSERPRRADDNITAYRNFLIEFDKISLEEQVQLVTSVNLPYSTAVYSGGKSIHYIISLDEPLMLAAEYKQLATRIFTALGGVEVVDTQNCNPSRLSRMPFAKRDGVMQELLEVRGRVSRAALEEWLQGRGVEASVGAPTEVKYTVGVTPSTAKGLGYLRVSTLRFLEYGAPEGFRNKALYTAACDFAERGFSEEEACERLMDASLLSGLDGGEVLQTIASAYAKFFKSAR